MDRYRHEYKYMLSTIEENVLLIKAEGALQRDPYAGAEGFYCVRSLYFDDYGDSCLLDHENGTDPRSKFRLRYYNDDREYIRLEKKSRLGGISRKSACLVSREECSLLVRGTIPEIRNDMPEEKKRLLLEMSMRALVPRVIVSFERIPFVYPAGEVRITFDRKIESSAQTEDFLSGHYPVRPVMAQGYSILEVKWTEMLPLYIKSVMQTENLNWTSFSKYCMCRTYHL